MEKAAEVLRRIDDIVWGPAMIIFILGTGIWLMVKMRFLPVRNLGYALKCVLGRDSRMKEDGDGDISSFSSLMTELAATIGTGNIVGVATAMVLGGPGALLWMMLSALTGFSTKFAESMLSVKYRVVNEQGGNIGRSDVYDAAGISKQKDGAALWHTVCCVCRVCIFRHWKYDAVQLNRSRNEGDVWHIGGADGAGGNSVCHFRYSGRYQVHFPRDADSCAVYGGILYGGGAGRYHYEPGKPSGRYCSDRHDGVFSEGCCRRNGGTLVVSAQQALRWGVSRGVFSNEAGLGAAGISAAAANTDDPVRQGYISMTGVFLIRS